MLKSAGLIAAAALVAGAVPALGQGIGTDAALDCGVGHAFVGGAIEQDDPGLSAELISTAEVWMAIAFDRFEGDEDAFNARIDVLVDALSAKLSSASGDNEADDYFGLLVRKCDDLRGAHPADYAAAAALMAQE